MRGASIEVLRAWRFGIAGANDYTSGMDSVRFGRALGLGARGAAKALAMAADAASSPNPSDGRRASPAPATASGINRSGTRLGETTARTTQQVRQTTAGVARGGKRFGEAAWGPFVKVSGQLWLELAGVFFGLFVLTAGINAWKLRAYGHDSVLNHSEHQHLLYSIAMAVVFGYFCVSSFVKASRRGKRS